MADRIVVVHPQFRWGGSEARALRAIEALREEYLVKLVTSGPFDLKALNEYYGTNLQEGDFSISRAWIPPFARGKRRFAQLRGAFFARHLESELAAGDLPISTYNVGSFAQPGIHCIADFSFKEGLTWSLDKAEDDVRSNVPSPLLGLYDWTSRLIHPGGGISDDDVFVSNSEWSAKLLEEELGVESEVVFPPVHTRVEPPAWEERDCGFVVLGRLAPEKRIERVFRILSGVRNRGFDVGLTVVGGAADPAYADKIKRVARDYGDWIRFTGRLVGEEKDRLLSRHRYAINGRPQEPFGIAAAEAVQLGCVTFTPAGGGQAEIVDDRRLTFESVQEAIRKITQTLEDKERLLKLRTHLSLCAEKFSAAQFKDDIRRVIKENEPQLGGISK